jgi:hypothetical protein
MAQVEDNRPYFIVCQYATRTGHAGRLDAIIDDPLQLTVGIFLHVGGRQGRNWRRHVFCKRHAGVLAVEAVACDAVVTEGGLAIVDVFFGYGQWVMCRSIAHQDIPLGTLHQCGFQATRRSSFTSGQYADEEQ